MLAPLHLGHRRPSLLLHGIRCVSAVMLACLRPSAWEGSARPSPPTRAAGTWRSTEAAPMPVLRLLQPGTGPRPRPRSSRWCIWGFPFSKKRSVYPVDNVLLLGCIAF